MLGRIACSLALMMAMMYGVALLTGAAARAVSMQSHVIFSLVFGEHADGKVVLID